jgi:hypothetical protein
MQVEQQSDSSSELETEVNQTTDESNKPGETEDSLLAVVQSVSAQSDEQSTDAGDTDSPTEEQSQDTVNEQADGEQPEDFSKLPFNKHPRFRELVKEKNSYKTQVAEYEADAKQYREIQGFMQANGLTAEEVAQSLETLAKMKTGDPAKAYELMQERMEAMAVAAGKKLPAELEEKVEQGYIDRETAQELYQRQAEAERKAEMASTQLERQSQQDQQAQVHAMASAVAAWEQSTKATDPDFDLKAELVKDRVRAHVAQHGMPKTTDAALKMSKDAYDAVTQTLLRVRGDKTPMRTAVGGKTNGSAAPEPKSLLDVVRRASAGA